MEAKNYKENAKSAADIGNPEAMFFLGKYYYEINNANEAEKYFLMAANKNYSPAMEELCSIYKTGLPGVINKDLAKAAHWAEKSFKLSSISMA